MVLGRARIISQSTRAKWETSSYLLIAAAEACRARRGHVEIPPRRKPESNPMSFLGTVKKCANAALLPFNHRIDFHTAIPQTWWLIHHLERAGLRPRTVIDIGVADGTPWIYDAWPDAKYHLVDPTPQSLPHMQRLAEKLRAEIHNVAMGDKRGNVQLNVPATHPSDSTLFEWVDADDDKERMTVPIVRFDEELPAPLARPALVKIDVQGSELMVLRGMGQRIQEIDCIIVETSVIATIVDGPELFEITALMNEAGFALFDIIGILRRPLDQAVAQIDAVFVPQHSPLRRDRRWHE
jgi:FkbM family methyltransferase